MTKNKKIKSKGKILVSLFAVLVLTLLTAFFVNQITKPQLQKSEASSQENIGIEKPNLKPEGVIVKYKSSQTQDKISRLKKYVKNENSPKKISNNTYALETTENDVENTIEDIKREEGKEIEYVEPDYKRELYLTPNDPLFKDEWWLKKIEAEKGWDINKGSANVTVAIIDTGVAANHPDISPRITEWYNFVGGSEYDVLDHGTRIAGIIGAITNNQIGIAGVNHNIKIISLKVVAKKTGDANDSDIIKAINKAVERKADIINISLGGGEKGQALQDAINYAWNKGVFITAAAGNDHSTKITYSAGYDHVFAVAATDQNDSKASFSNYGGWVDISAPGVSILSTSKDGSYKAESGTSGSSPIVAGVAALIKAQFPNYTNAQIEQRLCETADKINKTGQYWKCGRVNLYKALQSSGNLPSTPQPTSSVSPTPTNTPNPTLPPNKDKVLSFRIRFQGITQKANNQKIDFEIYQNSSLILKKENQDISNDNDGIYTFYLDNSDNKITPGRYTIRIKGESHLGKKYENIEIKSSNDAIDLTSQEAKAGDLNNDNKITITDISQVLSYYVTFSKNVNPSDQKMVASDVNKDGKITIIDIALTALNWSDLTVNGE